MKEWKCYYCKKVFDSMFERDRTHHPTHIEHWKKLWDCSLDKIKKLEKALASQRDKYEKLKEEFAKVKEERNDFLKVLQAGNIRDLKLAKKVKLKKHRRLIDLAEELGLIERYKDDLGETQIIQIKEKEDNVTNEWNELDIFIDKPQIKHIHANLQFGTKELQQQLVEKEIKKLKEEK